jgi:hypothetical protein
MPIETWFPTVIFYDDLVVPPAAHDLAMQAIRELVGEEDLARVPRQTAFNTPNTLHLDPRLEPLLAVLFPPIRWFLFEVLNFDPEITEFFIGRCWPVVQTGIGEGGLHCHTGGILSGVFYLETPEGSGALEFHKPGTCSFDHLHKKALSPLTFKTVSYAAVPHRLLLFPSDLEHKGLPNREDTAGPRVAIAFDLYSMTDIGTPVGGIPHPRNRKPIPRGG